MLYNIAGCQQHEVELRFLQQLCLEAVCLEWLDSHFRTHLLWYLLSRRCEDGDGVTESLTHRLQFYVLTGIFYNCFRCLLLSIVLRDPVGLSRAINLQYLKQAPADTLYRICSQLQAIDDWAETNWLRHLI